MRSHPLVTPETPGQITEDQNRAVISESLRARMQEMLDLAAMIEAGTATAADQRRAVVLNLRGVVRLTRLQLNLLDQTD